VDFEDLVSEYFRYKPGLIVHNVAKNCCIWWATIVSQMDNGPELYPDLARDQLLVQLRNGKVIVKRINSADRIIHDEAWRVLSPHDPKLFAELHRIVLSL